jgi:two-component system sensor histidine kinase MtrB
MSIRAVFATLAALLLVAAAASVATLLGVMINQSQATSVWTASAHSIQTAQDLELSLLRLNRLRLREDGDREADEARARRLQLAMNADLDLEARSARSAAERRLVGQTADAAHAYAAVPAASPLVERRLADALDKVDDLVAYDVAATEAAEQQALGRYRAAADVASGAAVLLIIGVAVSLVSLQRIAVRPLTHLRGCIEAFAGGNEHVRAACAGPTETRAIAVAFNGMADRLVAHRARERTFIAGVAHDLRTPLSALRVATEIAAHDETWADAARAQRVARVVAHQVSFLERMATDLLDDTMLQAGRLHLDASLCDLRQVAEAVVDVFRAQPLSHRIDLAVGADPVWVNGDVARLQQVMTNLVSNAVRYSPEGSTVSVRITAETSHARLDVADEGPGIPESERGRIFEAFQRGARERSSTPGAGLGLALTLHIVKAHAGTVAVDSGPSGGTTFTVRLPQAAAGDVPLT